MECKEDKVVKKFLPFLPNGHCAAFNGQQLPVVCPFCGDSLQFPGCCVRLKSQGAMNRKLQKLLRKQQRDPSSLGKFQQNFVRQASLRKKTFVLSCCTCKKSYKHDYHTGYKQYTDIRPKVPVQEDVQCEAKTRKEKRREKKKLKKKAEMTESGHVLKDTFVCDRSSPSASYKEQHTKSSLCSPGQLETSATDLPMSASVSVSKQSKNSVQRQPGTKPTDNLHRKNKHGKIKHKTLSKILQQDKRKSDGSSLSTFLSSL